MLFSVRLLSPRKRWPETEKLNLTLKAAFWSSVRWVLLPLIRIPTSYGP